MKKGLSMPEDIGMTLVFLVVLMVIITIALLTVIFFQFNVLDDSGPISYSVDFAQIANKPFMLTNVLAHAKIGDRQMLEQSIQSVVTGSLDSAQAAGLPEKLEDFVRVYDLDRYRITIEKGGTGVMTAGSAEAQCGENLDGWCVGFGAGCDVGRIKIDDAGLCGITEVCCKQDLQSYRHPTYNVSACNSNRGICSAGRQVIYGNTLFNIDISGGYLCSEGQIRFGQLPECANVNNGDTLVCCGEKTEEPIESTGIITRATVPLLYKDNIGYMEVEAK